MGTIYSKEEIIKIIAEIFNINKNKINETSSIKELLENKFLIYDYTDCAFILFSIHIGIEKHFNIKLSYDFMDNIFTIGDIIQKLKEYK